jgi:hypothetical protein
MDVYLAGFRSRGVAVGLVQLVGELRRTGALDSQGVTAIVSAIAEEFTVTRPVGQDAEAFRARVKERLDRLLSNRTDDNG